jgi:hypothetical protein
VSEAFSTTEQSSEQLSLTFAALAAGVRHAR